MVTVMLWQFFSDDVCASRNVPGQGGSKKYGLIDLELISRHGAPSPKHFTPVTAIMRWLRILLLAYMPVLPRGSNAVVG